MGGLAAPSEGSLTELSQWRRSSALRPVEQSERGRTNPRPGVKLRPGRRTSRSGPSSLETLSPTNPCGPSRTFLRVHYEIGLRRLQGRARPTSLRRPAGHVPLPSTHPEIGRWPDALTGAWLVPGRRRTLRTRVSLLVIGSLATPLVGRLATPLARSAKAVADRPTETPSRPGIGLFGGAAPRQPKAAGSVSGTPRRSRTAPKQTSKQAPPAAKTT
jgi:hypothetical protein